jgi:hypothetical protein
MIINELQTMSYKSVKSIQAMGDVFFFNIIMKQNQFVKFK